MSIQELIKKQVDGNRVVLYMKGSPDFPQCGFSANAGLDTGGADQPAVC